MGYGVRLKVWGDYASFNRPEMKVERVSYDVMTPSAARGVLEAIYWKPAIRWVVDRLHVLKPIQFTHVRRNEVKGRIPLRNAAEAMRRGRGASFGIAVEDDRQQRASMVLCDVAYGIEAHIQVLEHERPERKPEAKHLDQFNRRVSKGACFHHPYLGTREFPAEFAAADEFPDCPAELRGDRDLGWMLHDIVYLPDKQGSIIESNRGQSLTAEPRFFRAVLRNGIIDVPPMNQTRS